jgi:hypothetical protein
MRDLKKIHYYNITACKKGSFKLTNKTALYFAVQLLQYLTGYVILLSYTIIFVLIKMSIVNAT